MFKCRACLRRSLHLLLPDSRLATFRPVHRFAARDQLLSVPVGRTFVSSPHHDNNAGPRPWQGRGNRNNREKNREREKDREDRIKYFEAIDNKDGARNQQNRGRFSSEGREDPLRGGKTRSHILRAKLKHEVRSNSPNASSTASDAAVELRARRMEERSRKRSGIARTAGYSDPLKLEAYVRKSLSAGEVQAAADAIKKASPILNTVSSWNQLIAHELMAGRMNEANKLVQDMKKRAISPNEYTYMTLLKGYGRQNSPSAVTKTLALWASMTSEQSKLRPNTKHYNAMLQVCARAHDMKALWQIASSLPEDEGKENAADAWTYTTILNAIRMNALKNMETSEHAIEEPIVEEEQEAEEQESGQVDGVAEAIADGKRLWSDIIFKWKSQKLVIDAELVAVMGRLLLAGTQPRDWHDVLALVHQTSGIPILIEHGPSISQEFRTDAMLAASKSDGKSTESDSDIPKELKTVGGKARPKSMYVQPSTNLLSVALEACGKLHNRKAAEEYWNLFTDPDSYALKPDLDNLKSLLRMLHLNRSSTAIVEILQSRQVQDAGIKFDHGVFRIALSACVRNKTNENFFQNAMALLDLMDDSLDSTDFKSITIFLEMLQGHKSLDNRIAAVERMKPVIKQVEQSLKLEIMPGGKEMSKYDEESALMVLRRTMGLIAATVDEPDLDAEKKKAFETMRGNLSTSILKYSPQEKPKPEVKRGLGQTARATAQATQNVDTNSTEEDRSPLRKSTTDVQETEPGRSEAYVQSYTKLMDRLNAPAREAREEQDDDGFERRETRRSRPDQSASAGVHRRFDGHRKRMQSSSGGARRYESPELFSEREATRYRRKHEDNEGREERRGGDARNYQRNATREPFEARSPRFEQSAGRREEGTSTSPFARREKPASREERDSGRSQRYKPREDRTEQRSGPFTRRDESDSPEDRPSGRPQRFEGREERSSGRPQRFGGREERSASRPQRFGDREERSASRPQRFGDREERSASRPKRFEDRSERSASRPQSYQSATRQTASNSDPFRTAQRAVDRDERKPRSFQSDRPRAPRSGEHSGSSRTFDRPARSFERGRDSPRGTDRPSRSFERGRDSFRGKDRPSRSFERGRGPSRRPDRAPSPFD